MPSLAHPWSGGAISTDFNAFGAGGRWEGGLGRQEVPSASPEGAPRRFVYLKSGLASRAVIRFMVPGT